MGYRSDIRIRTTKKGYEIIKKEVEKKTPKDYANVMQFAEINFKENNEIVTIDFIYLKWYECFEDVQAVMNSLEILKKKNIDFQFMRIGEELTDIEEIWNVYNESFETFCCNRYFEN